TDDRHLTYLLRVKPTVLDERAAVPAEVEVHHGDILNAARHVAVSVTGNADRLFVQQVENDGDVVRREVPRHVDVFLKQTEIEAASRDILHFADISSINDL